MNDSKRETASAAVVALLALAYLVYFFSLDLPNAAIPGDPGQHYSRLKVWQFAIPGYVPGSNGLAAQAIERLVDLKHLPQRFPIFGVTALIVAAAVCLGSVVMRGVGVWRTQTLTQELDANSADSASIGRLTPVEHLVLSFGLGMSALSLATLGFGVAGWLNRPAVIFLLIGAVMAVVVLRWRDRRRKADEGQPARAIRSDPDTCARRVGVGRRLAFGAGGVAVGAFLMISILGAALPATDFDVREYHVQGPKEFFLAGRIDFAPHNVYLNMPLGTEMLTLLGMVVAGDWWWGALAGQVVLATFGPMTALGIWSLARRLFCAEAGWLAALIYWTTPWVYRISIIPYTENALCFYLLAGALAAVLAFRGESARESINLWLLGGVMAGSAAACKYPALISTVVPLGAAAIAWSLFRRFSASPPLPLSPSGVQTREHHSPIRHLLQSLLPFALGVLIAFGPWLAKNWVVARNPLYPLLYGAFGGRNWTPEKNAKWEWGHRVPLLVAFGVQRPPEGKAVHPHDPQTAITPRRLRENVIDVAAQADWQSPLVFGLAPLALAARRGRFAAAWLWVFVAYLFFQWWLLTHRLDRFWVPLLPIAALLAGAGAVWSSSRLWRSFLAVIVPLVVFYNFSYSSSALCGYNEYNAPLRDRTDPQDPAVNWMNQHLPQSAGVLVVGAADLFHLDRPVVYNTVFDDSIFEKMVRDRSPADVARTFAGRGITHVYVSWAWVGRYREPGNYGFTDFVVPSEFHKLTDAGVLRQIPLERFIPVGVATVADEQIPAVEIYEVVPESP